MTLVVLTIWCVCFSCSAKSSLPNRDRNNFIDCFLRQRLWCLPCFSTLFLQWDSQRGFTSLHHQMTTYGTDVQGNLGIVPLSMQNLSNLAKSCLTKCLEDLRFFITLTCRHCLYWEAHTKSVRAATCSTVVIANQSAM